MGLTIERCRETFWSDEIVQHYSHESRDCHTIFNICYKYKIQTFWYFNLWQLFLSVRRCRLSSAKSYFQIAASSYVVWNANKSEFSVCVRTTDCLFGQTSRIGGEKWIWGTTLLQNIIKNEASILFDLWKPPHHGVSSSTFFISSSFCTHFSQLVDCIEMPSIAERKRGLFGEQRWSILSHRRHTLCVECCIEIKLTLIGWKSLTSQHAADCCCLFFWVSKIFSEMWNAEYRLVRFSGSKTHFFTTVRLCAVICAAVVVARC